MDVFTTAVLARVVEALENRPISFLLSGQRDPASGAQAGPFGGFFPEIQTEDGSEEIHFDVEGESRRITPFVSPLVAGKVVKSKGYTTKSFKPAYAKDKRRFDPNQPLKRSMGEAIGGNMSAQERRDAALRMEILDQLRMLTRREEAMAAEVLRTGVITVTGDGYGTVSLDFGRDAGLTVTLTTTAWDQAGSHPINDLEAWAVLMQDAGGGSPTDVIMSATAWQAFRVHTDVQNVLDVRRGGMSQLELGALAGKVRQPGSVGDFRIWVYTESYVDESGSTVKFIPDDELVMVGPEMMGTRAYGVIRDEAAQYAAERFFIKSWLEEDPAVRWLLLQSAPLVVPYRPNASLGATVL